MGIFIRRWQPNPGEAQLKIQNRGKGNSKLLHNLSYKGMAIQSWSPTTLKDTALNKRKKFIFNRTNEYLICT